MDLLFGAHETNFVNNTIKIPKIWRTNVKTNTVYCFLDTYESENDKTLTEINCAFECDDYFLYDAADSEVFTIAIDKKKRMHIPQKYMDKCGFKANSPILLIGLGNMFSIQTEWKKIKPEIIEEFKRLINEDESFE